MNLYKLFLAGILACIAVSAKAQSNGTDYTNAIGIKYYPGAFTFKHFMDNDKAVEVLASVWSRGYRFTGLYEIHGDISAAPGLKWYAGGGAHFGAWRTNWKQYYATSATFGIDGVLGLDYKVSGAPLDIAVDWLPTVNLLGRGTRTTYRYDVWYGWGGVCLRYAF